MATPIKDLTGQRFGKLTVEKQVGRDKWGQVRWFCVCDCGNTKIIVGGNLRRQHGNNSCGCAKAERLKETYTKHGHTIRFGPEGQRRASREYRSWQGMKKRCYDPKHIYFHNYGARGVSICERWLNSFENFLSDMGSRPEDYTLDRIDVNGNYEPSNCRWASWTEQARNKR